MSSNIILWSDDVLKRAAVLWKDGHSASQIAKAIGTSRNAVCGKAFRHPDIFPPRGTTGGASAARRVVEKLRGPREATVRAKAGKPARTPPLSSPKPEPVALPDNWTARDAARYDLDRYQRDGVEPVAFRNIGRSQCHFPLQCFEAKAGPDTLYCAAPVAGSDAYCAEHRRLMTGGL